MIRPGDESASILERIARFRAVDAEIPPIWQAKRELAAAVRGLVGCICATGAGEEDLYAAATALRAIAARFAAKPVMSDQPGVVEMALSDNETVSGMENFHDRSPVIGRSNPIAPPLQFVPDLERGLVTGTGCFGNAYEGAPGCVHGGFVAAALDELLGMACIFSGNPGMTGTLEIRYRSPTPARQELRLEGRLDRVDGRRLYTSGALWAGDVCCAEATGIFISIDRRKFELLNEERRRRSQNEAEE